MGNAGTASQESDAMVNRKGAVLFLWIIVFVQIWTISEAKIVDGDGQSSTQKPLGKSLPLPNDSTSENDVGSTVKHLPSDGVSRASDAASKHVTGRQNATNGFIISCDFNTTIGSNDTTMCFWSLTSGGAQYNRTNWQIGTGYTANFRGGPPVDSSNDTLGGYAFFDVSLSRWSVPEAKNGWLVSQPFQATDPNGLCMSFQYNLNGLGIDSLRVLLLYNEVLDTSNATLSANITRVLSYDTAPLWESNHTTNGKWKIGHISFGSQTPFKIVFEAVPSTVLDKYEGNAAIDSTVFSFGPCPGDCNFDFSFCSWENVQQGDEFDWKIGRGTTNTVTGPLRDHPSTEFRRLPGGYAYIDSSYPRRAGDRAQLVGPVFPVSIVQNEPYCLTFWMSAFGPKVGELNISLVPSDPNCTVCTTTEIWKLRPDKLVGLPDLWFLSQAILVSQGDFRIMFEATVGDTGESDLAIDDISFQPGVCPSIPSAASHLGDCSFDDQDICGWMVKSINQAPYSAPLWEKVQGGLFPGNPTGRARIPRQKMNYYMRFDTNNFQHAPLDRAWLLSPVLSTTDYPAPKYCLSFWVNMYALVPNKDGLGALQVLVVDSNTTADAHPRFLTVWRLTNHQDPRWIFAQVPFVLRNGTQIAFEGIEGLRTMGNIAVDDIAIFPIYNSSICQTTPGKAQLREGDCSFDTDTLCGWTSGGSIPGAPTWALASSWDAPNLINDHTFGAPRSGFVFYNPIVQQNKQQAVLESPEVLVGNGTIGGCFGFWFLATGSEPDDAVLTIADRSNGALGPSELLKINHKDYVGDGNTWHYGQVTVGLNKNSFRVYVYATGTQGAFAMDDVSVVPVTVPCATRPVQPPVY